MHNFGKPPIYIALSLIVAVIVLKFVQPSAAQSLDCPNRDPIVQSFASGAKWELCWEARAHEGIVLSEIHYTTAGGTRRKVLQSAAVAQIFAVLDDGSARLHQVTDVGLGGEQLGALNSIECPQTLHQHNSKNVLCSQELERGYLYKFHHLTAQAYKLQLHSVSIIGEQAYVIQWSFFDDGIIEPAIGYSGQLAKIGSDGRYGWPLDRDNSIGVGQLTTAYWRLDFDLGGNGANDVVEEMEAVATDDRYRKELNITSIVTETGRTVNPDTKRSWRVRDGEIVNADGQPISYQLEPLHIAHNHIAPDSEPWTVDDIYFTVEAACEQFVSHNPIAGHCGDNVTDFVNGETLSSADLILWYGITSHHLPRDEDEPYRNIHWDSFQLVPRDWTAVSEVVR